MDYRNISHLANKFFRSKFFFWLEVVVSAVFGITLVFPVLGTLLALNELVRLCVKIYLWRKYDDSVKLCDDEIGTNYLLLPAEGRHTVLYLGEMLNTVDVDFIREKYQKHVIESETYSKFTYTFEQKLAYTCMKKCETFDIKNHIRYYPGTEERTVSEDELLKEILPELCLDMTDLDKPQWEEVIIPFYKKIQPLNPNTDTNAVQQVTDTEKTISLRIIRMHHAYMDGASVLLLIANKFSGEGATFPFVIDPCKPLKISKLSMFLYKLTSLALFSSFLIRNLLSPPFLRFSRFTVSRQSKKKVLLGWTNKISIDYFRAIKEKSGVSMPSIISSTLSSSFRSLELKYHSYNEENQNSRVPAGVQDSQPIWLVAAMFPYSKDRPGNQHAVVEIQVDTSDISGCERLSIMNDDLGRLARNSVVLVNYWFEKTLGRIPTPIAVLFLKLTTAPVIVSNIPLCTKNIKLWGNECAYISGWVPLLARTGLGIVSVRYADHIRYCIQADPDVMSQEELDYFALQIEHHVEQLFMETAQLKRRISTESSSFDHGNDKEILLPSEDKSTHKSNFENDNDPIPTNPINNNKTASIHDVYSKRGSISTNYSFLARLKDGIDQFRDGIKKVKQQ